MNFSAPRINGYSDRMDYYLPVIGKYMTKLLPVMKTFSHNKETLLIHGPTGSGKSRLALWCHHQSKRKEQTFEVLDLATIPEDMKMAALFGWNKGAYTGASQSNLGAIGRAKNGTLFIDEIDKLSLEAQAGLLQVLDSRFYRPLGDNGATKPTNVRFMIGTNANLAELVNLGKFREDLYYRINILPIKLPALVERYDEIEHWAKYMLDQCALENNFKGTCYLSIQAIELLLKQDWPGNLRQLDNLIRRSFALALALNLNNNCLIIEVEQIKQSLSLDEIKNNSHSTVHKKENAPKNLSTELWHCAEVFVDLAIKKSKENQILNLNETEIFKGYVLSVALKKFMNKKQVYQLFGKDIAIKNRTYQREIKRELDKAMIFEKSFGNQEQEY